MLELYILVLSEIPVILKFSEFFHSVLLATDYLVVGRPYLIVVL